jgi:hypothetical protein
VAIGNEDNLKVNHRQTCPKEVFRMKADLNPKVQKMRRIYCRSAIAVNVQQFALEMDFITPPELKTNEVTKVEVIFWLPVCDGSPTLLMY